MYKCTCLVEAAALILLTLECCLASSQNHPFPSISNVNSNNKSTNTNSTLTVQWPNQAFDERCTSRSPYEALPVLQHTSSFFWNSHTPTTEMVWNFQLSQAAVRSHLLPSKLCF